LGRRRFYNGTDVKDLEDTLSGGTNLEEQIAARLNGSQLRRAFEYLSEKQRTTLEMFFFEGCTLREISQRLDEPIESVRHHYYRGLAQLRKTTVATALQNGRQPS
jgi:RNA polymerase sigma-70 factor (ECF subfamily)